MRTLVRPTVIAEVGQTAMKESGLPRGSSGKKFLIIGIAATGVTLSRKWCHPSNIVTVPVETFMNDYVMLARPVIAALEAKDAS